MLRTRLLWFSLGFGSTAATMAHFVFRDLLLQRHNLSSNLRQQFDDLDGRVSELEQVLPNTSNITKM